MGDGSVDRNGSRHAGGADAHSGPTDNDGLPLKSRVVKRSIVIGGHRTSVSLEDAFWDGLKEIARSRHAHLSDVVRDIDGDRKHQNLSSAIRLFVFEYFHR